MLDRKKNTIYEKTDKDLKTIASRKNLYSIQKKIDEHDIDFFKKVFAIDSSNIWDSSMLNTIVAFLNDQMGSLLSFKFNDEKIREKFQHSLNQEMNNDDISRQQEGLMCLHEHDFIPVFEQILKENDLEFLDHHPQSFEETKFYLYKKIYRFIIKNMVDIARNTETFKSIPHFPLATLDACPFIDLLHYIQIQYLRVNKRFSLDCFNEESNREMMEKHNLDPVNLMSLLLQYKSIELTSRLSETGYHIVLIKNESEIGLITSDVPVINTFALYKKFDEMSEDEMEFYFPLSPQKALLLTRRHCYKSTSTIVLKTNRDVQPWNQALSQDAERYLYSNSREPLQALI